MRRLFDTEARRRRRLARVRYISCDLDGSLLRDDNTISGATIDAIRELRRHGIEIIINSGRTDAFVREKSGLIGSPMPVVSLTGSLIMSGEGRALYGSWISEEASRLICETAGKHPDATLAAFTTEGILHETPNLLLPRYLRSHPSEQRRVKTLVDTFNRTVMYVAAGPYAAMQEIVRESARRFKDLLIRSLYQASRGTDTYYLELRNAGVNKGTALRFLARRLKAPRGAFAALGDFDNDIEMCRFAGVSAALRNATDSLKREADLITVKTNEEDGAAEFFLLLLDALRDRTQR